MAISVRTHDGVLLKTASRHQYVLFGIPADGDAGVILRRSDDLGNIRDFERRSRQRLSFPRYAVLNTVERSVLGEAPKGPAAPKHTQKRWHDIPPGATCTIGPSAVDGSRCGKPAARRVPGTDYFECADHALGSVDK